MALKKQSFSKPQLIVFALVFAIIGGLIIYKTFAATVYYVAPSGNDSNNCSQSLPCQSLQRAYNIAQAGETVEVAGGNYQSQNLSGTKNSSSRVTFRTASGQLPVFVGTLTLSDLHDVTITGFKFRTSGSSLGYRDLFFEACNSNVTVDSAVDSRKWLMVEGNSNITISNGDWGNYNATTDLSGDTADNQIGLASGTGLSRKCNGVTAPNSSNILIEGNKFHDVYYGMPDTQWNGVHPDCLQIDGGVDGITIRNNQLYHCGNTFFLITPDEGTDVLNVKFEQNVMWGLGDYSYYGVQYVNNPASGLYCGNYSFSFNTYDSANPNGLEPNSPIRLQCTSKPGTNPVKVVGNIFNKGPANDNLCNLSSTWDYNVFESSGSGCGTNQITGQVAYQDRPNHNYHLAAGSIAIDKVPAASCSLSLDIDNQTRPQGSSCDNGVDEYTSATNPPPTNPGDLNNDNSVNVTDLSILLSNYNTANSTADINKDGIVNITDLSILLSHFGGSYTPPAGNVIQLFGTMSPAQVTSALGSTNPATLRGPVTITGDFNVPANVRLEKATVQGHISLGDGSVFDGGSADGFDVTSGADNWTISNSVFDGKMIDNQNLIWDAPGGNGSDGWKITGNTFKNYFVASDLTVHAEALYVGGLSNNGLIANNTFTNNGNTAHIFFTWFGSIADPATSYPRNICVKGNTFGPTANGGPANGGAYYSIQFRDEIPASSNIKIDPSNIQTGPQSLIDQSEFIGACQ